MKKRPPKVKETPLEVSQSLARIAEYVPQLISEYTEGYAYGFERKDGRHYDHNQVEGEGRSSNVFRVTDPVLDLVIDQGYTRDQVAQAAKEVSEAEAKLASAYARLGRVFRSDYEPLRERLRAGDKTPVNVVTDYKAQEKYLTRIVDDLSRRLREVQRMIRRAS